MATNQKSGKITIANIVAIIGIVLLLVFTFLGRSYLSGGELGWDIVISLAITGFTAFLLWLMIKAKGAENRLDAWRKAEYAVFAVYILFAIPTSLFGGIMHFFVVNDQKDEIKMYAEEDLQKIDNLFIEYKDFVTFAISITGTGLHNATGERQLCDESLEDFMEEHNIAHERGSAQNFETIQKNKLLGSRFTNYKAQFEEERDEISNVVEAWSVMEVPFMARRIDELAANVEEDLSELSHEASLPYIICGSDGRYTIDEENQCRDFEVEGGIDSFKFKESLKTAGGFSLTALLVVLLIHGLILFNYLVAYRTSTLGIAKGLEEDGGIVLKL